MAEAGYVTGVQRPGRLAGARRIWGEANGVQRAAILVAILLLVVTAFAPFIAPHEPTAQSLIARLRPPIGFERYKDGYLLGTDELGRDVLSRSLYGLQLTLVLAALGATIGLLLGGALGLVAGIAGGVVDDLVTGAVDAQIAIPFTLIALLMLAIFGSSIEVMVLVLGLYGWEQYARILRAEVRRLMAMPFI